MPSAFSTRLLPALAGLIIAASTADAAPVPVASPGDVFLAFRAISGQGSDRSYLINLGPSTQFTTAAAGSSFTLNIGDIGADLTTAYGANWSGNDQIFWGAFATFTSTDPTIFGSRARISPGVQSPPWNELTRTARSATKSDIVGVVTDVGNGAREATANSAFATFQNNTNDVFSYSYQVSGTSTDFGTVSQWSSIEGSFSGGAANTVLDLYRLKSSAPTVSLVGKFTITSAGVVTFTAASAAPPATTDTDGDGFSDAQETAAGTNPNDSSDFFRAQVVGYGGTGNQVQFNTIVGRTYTVEYSENLQAGSWIPVGTPLVTTTAGVVTISDSDPIRTARAAGFYRVKVTQ